MKDIDKKQFEKLCVLQCTEEEICGFFEVDDNTLAKWCKRTYGKRFSEVFNQKRQTGKISLRRNQWKLSETSAAMAIFLGKQYLGHTDAPKQAEINDDPLDMILKRWDDASAGK